MRIISTFIALSLASPAFSAAGDVQFTQGQFLPAAAAARAGGNSVLAAKATLVAAAFQAATKDQALSMLGQAIADSEAALAKAPRNPEALLQRAVAVGYRAKLKKDAGDAKEARKEMEAAVKLAPDNALAWAALGAWHGDAIADVGPMLAGMVLKAKKSEALRCFEIALAKDPASAIYPTYYAFMLLRMDKDSAARAQALLQTASGLRTRDGFEAVMKARALQVLAPLKAGDAAQARALAAQLAPFGRVVTK